MFTDAEVMLSIQYDRDLRRTVGEAQALVDAKNSEIAMLRAALSKAQDALRSERAGRVQVEQQLADLKAMVLKAL